MWWLNVFFLVNGVWIAGHQLDGWAPRGYSSEQECIERKSFAEKECRLYPLKYSAAWFCTFGEPADEVPAFMRGVAC